MASRPTRDIVTIDREVIKEIALKGCTNSNKRFKLDSNVVLNNVECCPTELSLRLPDKSNVIIVRPYNKENNNE